MELAGQRVVVVGLGASGVAAARVCHRRGARVVGVDVRDTLPEATLHALDGIDVELGPHRRQTFLGADCVVVSPGVPSSQPDVRAAEDADIEVIGELGLAASLLAPIAPTVVAITGTNGKSTVTSFAGQLLTSIGRAPFVGGNLGDPVCNAVPDAGREPDWDCIVAECSSYQLERAGPFRARAGAFLNLSPDHLERHGTMEAYAAAKARLFAHVEPQDLVVVADDPLVLGAVDAVVAGRPHRRVVIGRDLVLHGQLAEIRLPGQPLHALDLSGVRVPGRHNLLNAAVAAALVLDLGSDPTAVQHALTELTALEHRMEVVHRGTTTWINDSKATNLDALRTGLAGLEGTGVVLLGGQAKRVDGHLGFGSLVPLLSRHRAVICFGDDGPEIADELTAEGLDPHRVHHMDEAILLARELARPGDVVLLSPGCASFDHFPNFAERGRIFRERVRTLLAAEGRP